MIRHRVESVMAITVLLVTQFELKFAKELWYRNYWGGFKDGEVTQLIILIALEAKIVNLNVDSRVRMFLLS